MKRKSSLITSSVKIFFIALLLVSTVAVSGVFSRYVSTKNGESGVVMPEEFCFECNFDDDGQYLISAGSDFSFYVRNYDKFDNVSESNISYTVFLDSECLYSLELDGGEKQEIALTISKEKFVLGKTYIVSVSSQTPFSKTISYTVTVVDDTAETYYTIADNGGWVQMDVYIGTNIPNSFTINYGNQLLPDNTNALMSDWTSSQNKGTLYKDELTPYTHYTLIFFGTKDIDGVGERTVITDGMTIIL